MPNNERKVEILEQALIQEMWERGQLGDWPDKLVSARFEPENFDHQLVKAFQIDWYDNGAFRVTPCQT